MSHENPRMAAANRAWLDRMLDEAQKDEWFGSLTIKIKKGVVRHVDKTEGLHPPSSKANVVYT